MAERDMTTAVERDVEIGALALVSGASIPDAVQRVTPYRPSWPRMGRVPDGVVWALDRALLGSALTAGRDSATVPGMSACCMAMIAMCAAREGRCRSSSS